MARQASSATAGLLYGIPGVYSTGAWRPSAGKLGFKDDFGEVSCFSVDYLM